METIELIALSLEGLPYLWAGNGPGDGGGDCSGMVQWCLHVDGRLPDFPKRDRSAQQLYDELKLIEVPRVGDLAFYSGSPEGRISHVVMVLAGGRAVGANGGDRPFPEEFGPMGWTSDSAKRIYQERMRNTGACWRVEKSHLFRRHFRGFRASPAKLSVVT